MIEIVDTSPGVDVDQVEYTRLLGYPRGFELEGRALELALWAREWYASSGRPWVYAREAARIDTSSGIIGIDGVPFTSTRLLKTLRDAGAGSVVIAAMGAGPELEAEAQRLWQEGKPDEYFFLEVFGSAVVEHLVTMTGARLCAWADGRQMAVLPHYSPGYPEWGIAEQSSLLDLVRSGASGPLPFAIETLESGMLRPKKSLLAVFGLTSHVDRVRPLTDLIPCENCSYSACGYRRAPYRRAPASSDPELPAVSAETMETVEAPVRQALDPAATYTVNTKALSRWSRDRLTLLHRTDERIEATFRYEGTTCTNMGRPLEFHYHVTLGPPSGGYRIESQRCVPAPADTGHKHMCGYLSHRERLMAAIDREAPLAGEPLDRVIGWQRSTRSAGCYCDTDSRQHKWGLVLETIHYALARPKPADAANAQGVDPVESTSQARD